MSPSFAKRFLSTPPVTEGTSTVILSVSSSTSVSPGATASPSLLSHLETVASMMDSPSGGTLIDVISDRTCEYCSAGEHSLCIKYKILGEHTPGTVAEYIVVPAINTRPIPAAIEPEVAAAFPLATLTAWRMAHTRAEIRPGERVLI